jgi:hypothetical protein
METWFMWGGGGENWGASDEMDGEKVIKSKSKGSE